MDGRKSDRVASETVVHSLSKGERRAHRCRNISRLGCMIADEGLYASTGEELDIELLNGVTIPARVIWARQGHVGLAFKRELNPATVRHLAIPEQTAVTDVGLRDRFGRLLPEWPGSRAA